MFRGHDKDMSSQWASRLAAAGFVLVCHCAQADNPMPAVDGRQLYDHHCAHCHDSGEGHPGTMRLAVRSGPEYAVLLSRTDLAPEYVRQIVRRGLGMMPPFRPTEINDHDLAGLAAYVGQNFALD